MSGLSELFGGKLSEEPGLGQLTLGGYLSDLSECHGDREALRWRDLNGEQQSWSYTELYEESRKVAKALIACGIGKGNRVGVLISNRPEWLFSTFGAAMTGAVGVALNTFSTQQELQHQLTIADVQVLLMEAGVASKNFVDDINALCPELANSSPGQIACSAIPQLRRVICVDEDKLSPGMQGISEFVAEGNGVSDELLDALSASVSPLDLGLVFFSSGSTAVPKAIQQTQRAATLQCWRFGRWYDVDENVRTWSANGFFWSGNFAMAFGSTLTNGGCLVLQRFFDPDETLELLEKEQISLAIAWPHQEARLKECPNWETADLSKLVHVDKNLLLATHPKINTDWQQPNGYGLTETFTFVSGFAGKERTDESAGPVLAGNTVRIIDPDSGEILPIGQTGEIIVKGPTLTPGYLKLPPEDLVDVEGFFHTDDAGYLDEHGNLFWKGRLGDIIKTGGANVSPAEIDAVISQHSAVQMVFTVGIPHETLGEIVVSCVVYSTGQSCSEDDIRQHTKQSLASYKVPRRVLFFEEAELPMTGSNKIKRPELKKLVVTRMENGE